MSRTFVGLGFGAIQSGLFLYEAFLSGNFDRLVVAEVVTDVVDAVRRDGGYFLNVATEAGVEPHRVIGVEIYNPSVAEDRAALVAALAEAQEVATALPSVDFFDCGPASIADLMREAFLIKLQDSTLPAAIVYVGENHNHAAELLEEAVALGRQNRVQFLNTVIGKMSGVVTDAQQIQQDALVRMTPELNRAILVEEFNRILISQITLPGFARGIDVLVEKPDLLPFEEAKLYGHNAAHALLGYLANERGCIFMSDAPEDLVEVVVAAFLEESGAALIRKYDGFDPLFTPAGFEAYVNDLIKRMLNPYLRDQVERVIRDPARKLGATDRLIGTVRLCLSQGVVPARYICGVRAALRLSRVGQTDGGEPWPWEAGLDSVAERDALRALLKEDGAGSAPLNS